MRVFVEDFSGNRIVVEVEYNATVLTLKNAIKTEFGLDPITDFRLIFNNRDLEDTNSITLYQIGQESTVCMAITAGGGYSVKKEDVLSLITPGTNLNTQRIIQEEENGISFFSFKPITKKSDIPYYEEVTKQIYHHGINDEDKMWIGKYTGPEYKKLKVQSYVLNPDKEQLAFLKGLYVACWAPYQMDLPDTVYHICTLTESSFSWYEPDMIFYTPAFISTSKRNNLKWPGNCKWEITLKKGNRHHAVAVKEWSNYAAEEEILLSCCTRFKVLSTHRHHKDYPFYVYLEFLDT